MKVMIKLHEDTLISDGRVVDAVLIELGVSLCRRVPFVALSQAHNTANTDDGDNERDNARHNGEYMRSPLPMDAGGVEGVDEGIRFLWRQPDGSHSHAAAPANSAFGLSGTLSVDGAVPRGLDVFLDGAELGRAARQDEGAAVVLDSDSEGGVALFEKLPDDGGVVRRVLVVESAQRGQRGSDGGIVGAEQDKPVRVLFKLLRQLVCVVQVRRAHVTQHVVQNQARAQPLHLPALIAVRQQPVRQLPRPLDDARGGVLRQRHVVRTEAAPRIVQLLQLKQRELRMVDAGDACGLLQEGGLAPDDVRERSGALLFLHDDFVSRAEISGQQQRVGALRLRVHGHGLKAMRQAALVVRQWGGVEARAHVVERRAAGRVEAGQLGLGAHQRAVDVRAAHVQLGAVVRGGEEARGDVALAETAAKLVVRALADGCELADPRRPLWGRQRVGGEVLEGRAVAVAAQLRDEEEAAVGAVRSGRGDRGGILGKDEG